VLVELGCADEVTDRDALALPCEPEGNDVDAGFGKVRIVEEVERTVGDTDADEVVLGETLVPEMIKLLPMLVNVVHCDDEGAG
jgi:hypothetical protein